MQKTNIWSVLLSIPVLAVPATPAIANVYLSTDQAQRALFPAATAFTPAGVTLSGAQLAQIKKLSGTPQRTATPAIWKVSQSGRFMGWVLIDQVIGKHEFITYATGISVDGSVTGVEIMRYLESYGGEVANPKWRGKFRGKMLADKFRLNVDIPNISGATLSSRNVTDGVKRLLAIHAVALAG